MKDVVLEVAVVVLSIWEELKTNAVSSSVDQGSIKDVAAYPYAFMTYLLDKVFNRLKAL